MQTQCPHCKTRFRVTETQVNTAKGFVRCGICKEVFNAFETTNNASQNEKSLADSDILAEQAESFDTAETNIDIRASDNTGSFDFDVTADTDNDRKDTFDFFDENNTASLQHVVPDNFREPSSASRSIFSTLLWGGATLLLTATLMIEYAWFNRDQFKHIADLQQLVDKICGHFECKNIAIRDATKIELVTRNVYTHPNNKQALMVNVTMKNNANFAQPYPVMQIDFSDIRGGVVAARRFFPAEYLDIEGQPPYLLPPDTSNTVTLEIRDPGKQAMTYEFNFL